MDTLILVALGVLSRLSPHPANMTAIGGLALLSGAKFSPVKALAIIFFSMFISDIFKGFHPVMWATYGSLALTIIIGWSIRKSNTIPVVAGATLISSFLFFLITNFAVWVIPGSMYPKTITGLMESYVMALPFFRNSIIGDILYTTIFFVGYELVNRVTRHNVVKESITK